MATVSNTLDNVDRLDAKSSKSTAYIYKDNVSNVSNVSNKTGYVRGGQVTPTSFPDCAVDVDVETVAPVTALDRRERDAGVPPGWEIDPADYSEADYAAKLAAARAVRARAIRETRPLPLFASDRSAAYGRTVLAATRSDLDDQIDKMGSRTMAIWAVAIRRAEIVRDGHADHAEAYASVLDAARELMPDDRRRAIEAVRSAFRVRESA